MLQSLFWKEWHEHKWKLLSIMAVLWGVTAVSILFSEIDIFGLAFGMLILCMVPLAVFVGLGDAASERSRGTLPFMQSLPVPTSQAAQVKLVMGLFTVVLPVILTVLTLTILRYVFDALRWEVRIDRGISYLDVAIFCSAIAASLFIWSAAFGVNRKDEVSAGSVALAVMVGWTSVLMYVISMTVSSWGGNTPWWFAIAISTAPGGVAIGMDQFRLSPEQFRVGLGLTILVHLLLVGWYVRRFGNIAEREIRSPQFASRGALRYEWLAPPRRSRFTAILWKQLRECGPIVLTGFVGSVAIALLLFAHMSNNVGLTHIYAMVAASVGFAIALIAGIGVVLYDLSPRLNTFWRSRPINSDLWFWTKFTTGLVVVLLAIYTPLVLMRMLGHTPMFDSDAWVTLPAVHLAIFGAAVMLTSLIRHAVYAAILSVAALHVGVLATWGAWIAAGKLGWLTLDRFWREPTQAQIVTGLLITFVISTLIAWLAVRYDWGRKSRY